MDYCRRTIREVSIPFWLSAGMFVSLPTVMEAVKITFSVIVSVTTSVTLFYVVNLLVISELFQ
ncbi:MAG: hypothetical protein LUG96_09230 [Tannerellaceae bacterium]|nr:hypothetical protein [Tannerellaceae bacterium]